MRESKKKFSERIFCFSLFHTRKREWERKIEQKREKNVKYLISRGLPSESVHQPTISQKNSQNPENRPQNQYWSIYATRCKSHIIKILFSKWMKNSQEENKRKNGLILHTKDFYRILSPKSLPLFPILNTSTVKKGFSIQMICYFYYHDISMIKTFL